MGTSVPQIRPPSSTPWNRYSCPLWCNHPDSEAIGICSNIQEGATCGLHAVSHLLAFAQPSVILKQKGFEQVALDANVRDNPSDLIEPGGSNYEFFVLNINLAQSGLACSPMTADDIQGREHPFANHTLPGGYLKPLGYLLRIPSHGGHWISLLPSEFVGAKSPNAALLCYSLCPAPFLLTTMETQTLLQAFAIDASTSQNDHNPDFVCFLVGTTRSG